MTCWAILKVGFHLWKNSVKTFAIKNAIKIKPAISTRSDDNFWSSLSEKKKGRTDIFSWLSWMHKSLYQTENHRREFFSSRIHNLFKDENVILKKLLQFGFTICFFLIEILIDSDEYQFFFSLNFQMYNSIDRRGYRSFCIRLLLHHKTFKIKSVLCIVKNGHVHEGRKVERSYATPTKLFSVDFYDLKSM